MLIAFVENPTHVLDMEDVSARRVIRDGIAIAVLPKKPLETAAILPEQQPTRKGKQYVGNTYEKRGS